MKHVLFPPPFSNQLLLTFDPILVEKVANVLYLVMQDNPNLQRLYLTGIFFFIMMYTGSNVLPVARSDCRRDAHGHMHVIHTHTLCCSDRSFTLCVLDSVTSCVFL